MYTIFLAFPNHTPALFSRLKKFNSFQTSGNFCHLLITFANSLNPDQDPSGPKPFDTLMVFPTEFLENLHFEKKSADDRKSMQNYLVHIIRSGISKHPFMGIQSKNVKKKLNWESWGKTPFMLLLLSADFFQYQLLKKLFQWNGLDPNCLQTFRLIRTSRH